MQESAHFIPTDFSNDFFKQIDLAMNIIKQEELKKKGISITQVHEITEVEMTQAFGITKEQMQRAAEIWVRMKGPKNGENHQPDYPKGMDWKTTTTVWKKRKKRYILYKHGIQKGLHLK